MIHLQWNVNMKIKEVKEVFEDVLPLIENFHLMFIYSPIQNIVTKVIKWQPDLKTE